jgi:hypothetical protein
MPDYTTRPLDTATWPDFAELVEAHNGVWAAAGAWPSIPRGRSGHNGTVAMFERQGFERTRRIGQTRWVVRKVVG